MSKIADYLKAVALIVIVSLLSSRLQYSIAQTNIVMLYILIVVIAAVRWGKGPSLVTAILSVIIFDFFFVPPHFSLTVADTQYLIAFVTLFTVAFVTSTMTLRAKEQAEAAKTREAQTVVLYNLSRDLTRTVNQEEVFSIVIEHLGRTFAAESAIYLDNKGTWQCAAKSPGFASEAEGIIQAKRIFANEKAASESNAGDYYLALKTAKMFCGVLQVRPKSSRFLSLEQYRLLETFAHQTATAIERLNLLGEAQQLILLQEAERLHVAFLNSVSHDLRTPLVSISGSLGSILQHPKISEKNKRALLTTAYDETYRLNQLVSDLLDMARVEAGALHLKKSPVDVKDLIGAALQQSEKILQDFTLKTKIGDTLPEIEIDFILMLKVLTNILDNAVKYSRHKKDIMVSAKRQDNSVEITIADRGIGIPPADLVQVFNKFYRVMRAEKHEGTGLGLSVCKGIVEAHGGGIRAENRKGSGTTIKLTLPIVNNHVA